MNLKRVIAVAFGAAALCTGSAPSALAAPPAAKPVSASGVAPASKQSPHASLRLDIGRGKAWVGQAVPVTLQLYFRGVEAATLGGSPQITSTGVFTSDLSREPRQATEIIGGEPVLVATWTGTLTPSSPGALEVLAAIPVRVRYRDAAPRVEMSDPFAGDPFAGFGGNPFAGLGGNPFDTSMFDHFFERAMPQALGRIHEQEVSLRATGRPIDVIALPTADQPPSFTGAIGRFDLKSSVSTTHAHVSEPVTLRIVVQGAGDLDRVDLAGVATSDSWKAYPAKATLEAAAKGARPRKMFEQVLVPLRGGDLSIPAVELTAFDPESGRYVTTQTAPLAVSVDGTALAADVASPATPATSPALADPPLPPPDAGPLVIPRVVRPTTVALSLVPVALLVAAAAVITRVRRRRGEKSLRRAMRKAAARGEAVPFYRAAHALIEARLSARWGIHPEDVSASSIKERLGPEGATLAEAWATDEALRFGRGRMDGADLAFLCSTVERSLGGAS